ncbi:MAG: ParB/RepB/Spo0J family partition protein [Candidatus Komeilibacteria bacterium]|nr:ParB/RepB/Spo0J family partition protein [Candidatus Komeilibacteria bacterium]
MSKMNLKSVLVNLAYESKTNPRGSRFEGQAFDDLVASVKEKGVLVPILVREKKAGAKQFEVIAGNRRLRAAQQAGLKEIPVYVVEMNDVEAREAAIVENLQREDVHPLEEGEAYRQLREKSKYEISAIAAKVGKSESYVKQRLFLTNLESKPADAYRSGKINDGHAVLIAQLSNDDQLKALNECVDRWGRGMSVKDLKDWIHDHIYSTLENQPWLKSKELMAAVGPCKECEPTRASLFGEVKEGACTNLKCWERKMTAYIEHRKQESKLTKISSEYSQPAKGCLSKSEYAVIAAKGKDKCESAHGAIFAEGDDLGKEILICSNKDCKTHGRSHSEYRLSPAEEKKRKADLLKEKENEKKKIERNNKATADLLKTIKWPIDSKMLNTLFGLAMFHSGTDQYRPIVKRRGWEVPRTKTQYQPNGYLDYDRCVRENAAKLDDTEKLRLTIEVLMPSYDSWKKIGVVKLITGKDAKK